eukprot:10130487-Alexandrium_andersonii.AAC.1
MGEDAFTYSIWGAAKLRPMWPCQSILVHGAAPVGRRPREGPDVPRGEGLVSFLGISAKAARP